MVTGGAVSAKDAADDAEARARKEEKRLEEQEAQRQSEEAYNQSTQDMQDKLTMGQETGEVASVSSVDEAGFTNALIDEDEEDKIKKAFRRG